MLFNLPEFSFVSHNPRILFQSNIMFETLLGWTMHTFQLFYIIHMPLTFPVQNCAILLFTPLWKSFWIAQCRICICFWAPIICFQTSICYHQTWTKLLHHCFGQQDSFFAFMSSLLLNKLPGMRTDIVAVVVDLMEMVFVTICGKIPIPMQFLTQYV